MLLSCFVMTVTAADAEAETPHKLSDIFTDTPEGAWYEEYVLYAYTRGLVSGMGDGTFAPNDGMTRAQLVTILYRMEGSPDVAYSPVFDDVAESDWFAKPVLWASSEEIVSGKGDGIFAPGDGITREQIAMILYRYAVSLGYDVSGRTTMMNKYPDSGEISSYAADAMSWAVYVKIIGGKALDAHTNILAPQGNATRAEVSVMLRRFIEDYSIEARLYTEYKVAPNELPENMKLYGVLPDFRRIPEDRLEGINDGVVGWAGTSSGGRVKFKTDSDAIKVTALLDSTYDGCGIDVFVDGEFAATFNPKHMATTEIVGYLMLEDGGEDDVHEITVYLSRNCKTNEIRIGLDPWAKVEEPDPYKNEGKPIVFYGSSITQGSGASSPSRAYVSVVCESLGLDYINLGFGGSAMGEPQMAEYISSLEMGAFVMDYDYNAPTLEHLESTHKPFFDIIRKAQPNLPILIVSGIVADNSLNSPGMLARRRVIMDTFHAAIDAGDKYVDFIDGSYLFGNGDRNLCISGDDIHPNDFGYATMAEVIIPRLKALLERP